MNYDSTGDGLLTAVMLLNSIYNRRNLATETLFIFFRVARRTIIS